MSQDGKESAASIGAVGIKMPAFIETAVEAWFSILEANFHVKKISNEEIKFFNLIASLPPDVVAKLSVTLIHNKKYEETKQALVTIHERTKPKLFSKLITKTTMSGRLSCYLQELSSIAAKVGVSDELVKHQFIQALPAAISPVVAAQKDLTLVQLGKLADELMPFCHQALQVSSTSAQTREYKDTKKKGGNDIPTGLRPFSKDQLPKICRAHIYFGEKARNCKPWCKFPNKSKCHMQPSSRSSSPAPRLEN